MKSTIAVIGGGITGVTTAYSLANRGYAVTLFEKDRYLAMETSFANGGQLSASNAEVWTHPSTILKGLKWMFKNDAPLLVNPKPTWHKISWFIEFISNIQNYEKNTIETADLAIRSREFMYKWAAAESINFDLEKVGILHIYRDKKSFDHAGNVSALLARGGLTRRALTPSEIREIEPTLAGNYYGGYFTDSDATGDIHKFTQGLAAGCIKKEVTIRYESVVTKVEANSTGVKILSTSKGGDEEVLLFDKVVICAGVESREVAKQLGDRVNIYPVKGYSITVNLLDDQSQKSAPTVSLLDDETKIVTSRLGKDRFRVAGTAEFNGYNKDIRSDRIAPLIKWVEECFPGVSTRQVVPWAGLRPMMPNMMPKFGRGSSKNVYYNTGHGHLGWTLSAITAELISEIIDTN